MTDSHPPAKVPATEVGPGDEIRKTDGTWVEVEHAAPEPDDPDKVKITTTDGQQFGPLSPGIDVLTR